MPRLFLGVFAPPSSSSSSGASGSSSFPVSSSSSSISDSSSSSSSSPTALSSFSSSVFDSSFSSPSSSSPPLSSLLPSTPITSFSSPSSPSSPSPSLSRIFVFFGYLFLFSFLVSCPSLAHAKDTTRKTKENGADFMTDLKVSPPCASAAAIFPCRCSNTSAGVVTLSCDGVTEAGVAKRALQAEGYGANPLEAFHLRWGTVTAVAVDFFGERSFKEVLLHHNRLETVEAGSLETLKEDLVTLDLNNNRLTVPLLTQLVGFNKLTSFGQSGNLLTDLADMAALTSTFPSLRILELAGNLIGNLPARVFQSAPEVHTVDLSFNNISYIHPEAFLGLTKVNQVLLEGNNLNHLGSQEVGRIVLYNEVALLSLKDSNIEDLEPGFVEGLGDRSNLALSRNPMLCFPEDVFGDLLRNITVSDIPEESGVDFYYNFIQCDCDFLWLAKDRWLNVHVYGGFCAPRSDDWKEWVSLHSVDAEELENYCYSLNTPEPPGPLRA